MSRATQEEDLDTRIDLLRQRIKDSDDLKVKGDVFDTRTLMNLYALASKGVIDALGGEISTGKEANLFYAVRQGQNLVIKIYRITTSNFKAMQEYMHGDPRFGNIKGTKRAVISAWTRKEFRNLKRAEDVGVRVPHPITAKDNILVMEFIGQMDNPAPQLRNVDLEPNDAMRAFEKLSDYITILYNKAELVHADFSEFNILYTKEPVVIDMGQSVTLEHPMASKFLARDVANLARYFGKRYGIGSEEEIWSKVKVS